MFVGLRGAVADRSMLKRCTDLSKASAEQAHHLHFFEPTDKSGSARSRVSPGNAQSISQVEDCGLT